MKENLPANYPKDYFSIMLRNVLEDYFSSIKQERDFDFPLMSLLAAMGFYDIHFTHGSREIGKDFIAKRKENDVECQYAIQSKKGDINQTKCSNEILPQLLLASVSGLSHPQFDKTLPRRVILVSTGLLIGNAPLILQDFNETLKNEYSREPVIFWGPNQLIPFFEEYGLTSVHQVTAKGFEGFAQFYLIYSKALDGKLSDKEIEGFSQLWLDQNLDYRKRILRASIESEILAVKLAGNGLIYEAIITYIALVRTVMHAIYEANDDYLIEVYRQTVDDNIIPLCKDFHSEIKVQLEASDKQLLALVGNQTATLIMVHYLVWCSRILEINSLLLFLSSEHEERERIAAFMKDFVVAEPGCGHPPSDRYAAPVVWTTLALIRSEMVTEAIDFIKKTTIWLCDRLEKGFGLADYDADEYDETAVLIGYAFSSIKVEKNRSSFLATALADLAAFTDDQELYSILVNDFAACEIAYEYWQVPDTQSVFTIYSSDSRTYPNSLHEPNLTTFVEYKYAQHIAEEPATFKIAEKVGPTSLILLSVLLKDRYFPRQWRQIIA